MLKEYVISHVKPDDYYKSRFPNWNPATRELVACPFHDDGAHPNLSIGLRNGGAHCHSSTCAKAIGNIVHFEAEENHISEEMASRRIYRKHVRPTISRKLIKAFRDGLLQRPETVSKVRSEMGLESKWISRFSIGFDTKSGRITIPVYDEFNQCVNIRMYRLPSDRRPSDVAKIHNFKKGYGRLDLFPAPTPEDRKSNKPILLVASEKEAMLARANGWTSFSSTTGEGSWNDSWNSLIKDRIVIIVFDNDKGGIAASAKLKSKFATIAKVCVSLSLPFRTRRKDRKDLADWILRERHSFKEFGRLVRKSLGNSSVSTIHSSNSWNGNTSNESAVIEQPSLPDFYDSSSHDVVEISSRTELRDHRIRVSGIVAAKAPNTYSIPFRFEIKAPKRNSFIYTIPMGRELMRFIGANDGTIIDIVRGIVGSNKAEIIPLNYITATQIEIIPTAVANSDAPYFIQRCYYFGERIDANVPYNFELIPTSEIRTQEVIGVITSCIPISRSIDRFTLTPEMAADLSTFQPTEGEDVWAKLLSVADEIAHRYTRVYNRVDWTLVAMLTWCSPIGWRFPNEPELQRGWLNSLALGDTETGKSKVAKGLQQAFNCGVFVSGENCTFAGLIGGAIKGAGDRLMLRWGRIPISDKQLVILEELSGLSVREIADMSDVRSSGVARLDKGGINSETNARTRLLFLSNARDERRSLSSHIFGVHAVHELIGHGEDIARFDFITTLVDREVSTDVINSPDFATVAKESEVTFATDQLQKLVHWIWSLTPDQIEFSKEAYEECLAQTKKLSTTYHPSIPIFKGGSGRYKLGRIAASIACLQFACNSTTEKLCVTSEHVCAAAKLLRLCYNKPSLGYREFSQQAFARETVGDTVAVKAELKKCIPARTKRKKVIDTLIHSTQFTRDELQAIASLPTSYADNIIGVMVRERVLRKGKHNLWEITPAGKKFFDQLLERLN